MFTKSWRFISYILFLFVNSKKIVHFIFIRFSTVEALSKFKLLWEIPTSLLKQTFYIFVSIFFVYLMNILVDQKWMQVIITYKYIIRIIMWYLKLSIYKTNWGFILHVTKSNSLIHSHSLFLQFLILNLNFNFSKIYPLHH